MKVISFFRYYNNNLNYNELRFILLSSIGNPVIHSFSIDEARSLIGAVKEL